MSAATQGLYKDAYERDSCGFGLIANLDEFLRTSPPLDHAYRPLGDGWYLCISR